MQAEKELLRIAEGQKDDMQSKWAESRQQLQIGHTREQMHRSAMTGALVVGGNLRQQLQGLALKVTRLS